MTGWRSGELGCETSLLNPSDATETLLSCEVMLFLPSSDLDARAKSERYRALFRLPKDEKLDGHTDCTLWTPFNKMHILGQMFVSTNYICFTSKGENVCSLIIPLREVGVG